MIKEGEMEMKNDRIRVIYDSAMDDDGNVLRYVSDRFNLTVCGEIVAFGEVGRWDGRHNGYKMLGHNLRSIFNWDGYDSVRIYAEGNELKGILKHHDGTHYMTFRKIKTRVNYRKLIDGMLDGEDVSSFTVALKRYVPKEFFRG